MAFHICKKHYWALRYSHSAGSLNTLLLVFALCEGAA